VTGRVALLVLTANAAALRRSLAFSAHIEARRRLVAEGSTLSAQTAPTTNTEDGLMRTTNTAQGTRLSTGNTLPFMAALGGMVLAAAACSGYGDNGYTTPPETFPPSTVVSASGDVTAKVNEFRTLLGDPKNGGTVPGPAASGRREINWDGVNAANTNTNTFPSDFFNTTTKLGLITTTSGTGLRVSDKNFSDVNALYANDFAPFSPTKTFDAVGSNVIDVTFQVAAATTPAAVTGFGAVFSDVDVAGATTLEFFDKTGKRIGLVSAPVRSDATGLSFVGLKFASALVARVRMTLGNGSLGAAVKDLSDQGQVDLVIVDDFLYGEPVPF
jgi:hypothetical protein